MNKTTKKNDKVKKIVGFQPSNKEIEDDGFITVFVSMPKEKNDKD